MTLRVFWRHGVWFCTDDKVLVTAPTQGEALRVFAAGLDEDDK